MTFAQIPVGTRFTFAPAVPALTKEVCVRTGLRTYRVGKSNERLASTTAVVNLVK